MFGEMPMGGMAYGAHPQAHQSAFVYPLPSQPHFQGPFYPQTAAFDRIGAPMQSMDARAMDVSSFGGQPQYHQTIPTTSSTYMTAPDPYGIPVTSMSKAQDPKHKNPQRLQDPNAQAPMGYDN